MHQQSPYVSRSMGTTGQQDDRTVWARAGHHITPEIVLDAVVLKQRRNVNVSSSVYADADANFSDNDNYNSRTISTRKHPGKLVTGELLDG
ncbi:hypothetical protein ACLKA7_015200 [Drosophila subpalustris]